MNVWAHAFYSRISIKFKPVQELGGTLVQTVNSMLIASGIKKLVDFRTL